MDFASAITLKFNDLFSNGILQAQNNVLGLQSTLDGITGQGIGEVQSGITGLGAALDGIGEAASAVIPPLTEVQNNIDGISGQGIGEIQSSITGLGAALDGINPAPLAGIGEAVDAIIPSLAGMDEELAFPQAQNAFNAIGESWEEAIPYLASLEEQVIADYLHAQNAFSDISESWEDALPKMSGLGAALSALKSDTITQAKAGFAEMHAAMEQINANPLNQVATQLSIMANMTQPMRDALSVMIDEPSKLAGTFETAMKNIQAITGATGAEISALSSELLAVGGRSSAGPLAVADAFNDVAGGIAMVSEGVSLLDVQMQVLNNSLALAEAGQADLGTAAEGLTKIMNSYRFTMGSVEAVNERAAWASDVMTQAVGMGMGSMQEFISAMAPLSGTASSVGIGFDEIGSTLAYMTSTTDTAATAGTKLESFMIALQKPSNDLAAALKRMGYASGTSMLAELGLAESARVVSAAFGGNQDAITQAMGRAEAMKAVISLTGDAYSDFAVQFGQAMQSAVTAEAQAVQQQSYESKVARLQAASDALKIQIGEDVNGIKGFFVDIETGFLQHVAAPLLASPIGGVFSGMAAGAAVVGQSLLTTGSAALNAAAQFSVLAANISNAGGWSKFMHGALTALGAPFKAIGSFSVKLFGPLIGGLWSTLTASVAAAGGVGAFAASMWAAAWPVLAVVAAIALVGAGAYLLIKHWDTVKTFFVNLWNRITGIFAGLPNWVAGLIAVFLPFIGIPILIIKNWDTIKDFFASLWNRITGLFSAAWEWIKGVFTGLPNWVVGLIAVFMPFISIPMLIIKNWDTIKDFFTSLWENIKTVAAGFVTWFTGLWPIVVSAFTSAWEGVTAFFAALWEGIVSMVFTVANAISSAWTVAVAGFTIAWGYVYEFFSSIWQGIVAIVFSFVAWIGTIWTPVVSVFTVAWGYVYEFFSGIWEGIKGVILGFIDWISPAIELIIAPFRKVAEVVGGVLDGIGGFFKGLIGESDTAGDKIGENLAKAVQGESAVGQAAKVLPQSAVAKPELLETVTAKGSVMPAPDTSVIASMPVPDAITVPAVTVPALSVGQSAAVTGTNTITGSKTTGIILSPAKMNSPALTYGASNAFEAAMAGSTTATLTPSMDTATVNGQAAEALAAWNNANTVSLIPDREDITQQAAITFQAAMPAKQQTVQESPGRQDTQPRNTTPPQIRIEHLTVQAEDCENMFDFYRTLLHGIYQPEEAAV